MAYYMSKMTVADMREAMKKTKTVVIPVGEVEQHGYHLPLSVDNLNSIMPLELAGDKLNAVVALPINYCFSGGELPGTVNVNPNVFGLYLTEVCREFVRMGFLNIIIFLGHGGTENRQAMDASLGMMLRTPGMEKIAVSIIGSGTFLKKARKYNELHAPLHDFHAGTNETSRMLYWAPELVHLDKIEKDAPEVFENLCSDQDWYAESIKAVDHELVMPRIKQRDEVKVGVMGFPEDASKEIGKEIADEIINGLCDYVDFLNKQER